MKKFLIIFGSFLVLFVLFLIWFKATYSMEKIDTSEHYDKSSSVHILIASQGSDYKNKVVAGVIEKFKDKDVYFKVIDVSLLDDVDPKEWDAFVILYNWEIWAPEENSERFFNIHYDASKMFTISTSSSGELDLEGIDGITGASELTEVQTDITKVQKWLKQLDVFSSLDQ